MSHSLLVGAVCPVRVLIGPYLNCCPRSLDLLSYSLQSLRSSYSMYSLKTGGRRMFICEGGRGRGLTWLTFSQYVVSFIHVAMCYTQFILSIIMPCSSAETQPVFIHGTLEGRFRCLQFSTIKNKTAVWCGYSFVWFLVDTCCIRVLQRENK